jgi:hypothetical protein
MYKRDYCITAYKITQIGTSYFHFSPNTITTVINIRTIEWVERIARKTTVKSACQMLVRNVKGKRPLSTSTEDSITIYLEEQNVMVCAGTIWL